MAIRGLTFDIATTPIAAKNADEFEVTAPVSMDLRNGVLTDVGNWQKRPGLGPYLELGVNEQVDGIIEDDPGYAITRLNKVYNLATNTLIGTIDGTANFIDWVRTNDGIVVARGATLWLLNPSSVAAISGAPNGVTTVAFINGRVVVAGHSGRQIRWSDAGESPTLSWSDANVTSIDARGDSVLQISDRNNQLLVFTDKHIEVWSNTGAVISGSVQVFARSATLMRGAISPASIIFANDTYYWFGDDGDFYALAGSSLQVISAEYRREIDTLRTASNLYGIHFPQERIIRWYFPTQGRTLVYDYQQGFWSEDNAWVSGCWERIPVRSGGQLARTMLIGSFEPDGKVWDWSKDNLDDDGSVIRNYRQVRFLMTADGDLGRLTRLRYRVKRGTTPTGQRNSMFTWRVRMDRGDWEDWVNSPLGVAGDQDPWLEYFELGEGREVELEMVQSDTAEWIVDQVQVTVNPLGTVSRRRRSTKK